MRKSLSFLMTGILCLGLIYTGCDSNATPDTTAPVAGNHGALTASDLTSSALSIHWAAASDDNAAELSYKVVIATASSAIDTVEEISTISGSGIVKDWTAGITTASVSGLTAKTAYYINVAAMDDSDNFVAYTPVEVTTLPEKLYLFNAGAFDGNLGGRTGADAKVATSSNIPSGVTKTVAFLSVSSQDQLSGIPANYGFPESVPLYGPDGIAKIADNWADLLDGSIDVSLYNAGLFSLAKDSSWWSGSMSDGTVNTETCSAWTDNSGATNGALGDGLATDGQWIDNSLSTAGNYSNFLLGLGY